MAEMNVVVRACASGPGEQRNARVVPRAEKKRKEVMGLPRRSKIKEKQWRDNKVTEAQQRPLVCA